MEEIIENYLNSVGYQIVSILKYEKTETGVEISLSERGITYTEKNPSKLNVSYEDLLDAAVDRLDKINEELSCIYERARDVFC